jgi:hypothetical protein
MRDLRLRSTGNRTIQVFNNHLTNTQSDTNTIGIKILCLSEMLKRLENSLQV